MNALRVPGKVMLSTHFLMKGHDMRSELNLLDKQVQEVISKTDELHMCPVACINSKIEGLHTSAKAIEHTLDQIKDIYAEIKDRI